MKHLTDTGMIGTYPHHKEGSIFMVVNSTRELNANLNGFLSADRVMTVIV